MELFERQLPLFTFLKKFSFITFKYDGRCFKTTNYLTLYCVIIAILLQWSFWFVSTLSYTSVAAKYNKESEVTKMVHLLESWSLQFGLFPILTNAFLNQVNQVYLLNKILGLEGTIRSLKYQLNHNLFYKNLRAVANISTAFIFLYYLVFLCLFETYLYPDESTFLSQQVCILAIHMVLTVLFNLMSIFMILHIKIIIFLIQTLNFNLEQEICDIESRTNFHTIIDILEIHQKFYKICFWFSKSFGLSCLGIFLQNTGMVTCEVFLDYITLRNINLFGTADIIIYNCINFCWCLPLMVSFGIMCDELERFIHEFGKAKTFCEQANVTKEFKNEFQLMVFT